MYRKRRDDVRYGGKQLATKVGYSTDGLLSAGDKVSKMGMRPNGLWSFNKLWSFNRNFAQFQFNKCLVWDIVLRAALLCGSHMVDGVRNRYFPQLLIWIEFEFEFEFRSMLSQISDFRSTTLKRTVWKGIAEPSWQKCEKEWQKCSERNYCGPLDLQTEDTVNKFWATYCIKFWFFLDVTTHCSIGECSIRSSSCTEGGVLHTEFMLMLINVVFRFTWACCPEFYHWVLSIKSP